MDKKTDVDACYVVESRNCNVSHDNCLLKKKYTN